MALELHVVEPKDYSILARLVYMLDMCGDVDIDSLNRWGMFTFCVTFLFFFRLPSCHLFHFPLHLSYCLPLVVSFP